MFVWIKQAAGLRQSVLAAALLSLPLLVGHTTRAQAQPTLSISAPADAKEGDWATRDPSFKVRVSEVIWWSNIEFKVCFSGTATRDTTAAATIPASADYQLVDATGRKRLQAPQPGYFWPIPQTSSCVTDVIWAGGLDKIVEIWIKGDTEIEPDETVVATLSLIGTPPAGVTLGTSTATHTIKNDDHATGKLPQVSIHRTHRLIGQIVSWCPPMFEGADTIFTLIANPAPSSPITVTVDVTDSRDFATDGQTGSRTVTLGTDGTGSLTVTTVNDNTDEPEGYISATVQAGSDYTVGSPSSASTWMCDNDLSAEQEQESQETLCATPGLLLTSAVGSTEGAPLAFTLAALRAPVPQMSVTLSVTQVGDYIGPAELGRRTVTVPTSGSVTVSIPTVDDIVGEPDGTVTVTLKAGSGYTLSAPSSLTADVVDNDTPGVTIRETDKSTTVSEAAGAGNTDTYTVVLDSRPTHSVSITVTSEETAAATVSPSTLTFKPSAWNTAQMVTVTGGDDNVDQGDSRSVTIRHSATSTDSKYNGISIAPVSATVVDDDTAGVTIRETDKSTTVSEAAGAGSIDTYTVVLDTPPSDTVTVTVTAGIGVRVSRSIGTADSSQTLTFTTSTWNAPQAVTVRGVDDAIDNPNDKRTVTINHAADSNDPNYRIPNAGT
ncbi:MAG: hypothetical protein F4025_03735, partial [Synechococcus sp. SB0669_bin_7]|nr:hypothetical protein [Synechococcus sp. SB0669_bin_7]